MSEERVDLNLLKQLVCDLSALQIDVPSQQQSDREFSKTIKVCMGQIIGVVETPKFGYVIWGLDVRFDRNLTFLRNTNPCN